MQNLRFSINDNGVLTEYKILKILTPSNSDFQYIIYEDDKNNTYASRYELKNQEVILKPIEESYEWEYIDGYLEGEKSNGSI